MQRPAGGEVPCGLGLGAVLAAADEVQVARIGGDLPGLDRDELDADASPAQPLGEDGGVPPSP